MGVLGADCGEGIKVCECGDTLITDHVLTYDLHCSGSGLYIRDDNLDLDCNNHIINGSASGYGIYLDSSEGFSVQNCNVINFSTGVYFFSGSANGKLKNNNIRHSQNGIYLYGSVVYNNTIENNNIEHSQTGLTLYYNTDGNNITQNTIENNDLGLYIHYAVNYNNIYQNTFRNNSLGLHIGDESCDLNNIWNNDFYDAGITYENTNNNFCVNNITNNYYNGAQGPTRCDCLPILTIGDLYIDKNTDLCPGNYTMPYSLRIITDDITLNCNNATIDGHQSTYGIHIDAYRYNIQNCHIKNNTNGVYYYIGTREGTLQKNDITHNQFGIFFGGSYSDHNNIKHNNISDNDYGIYLYYNSNYNIFKLNNISRNDIGIYIRGICRGNTFHYNNIYEIQNYSFYNTKTSNVTAENNYWGTTSQAEIANSIYDYYDDASKGIVDFIPYSYYPNIARCLNGTQDIDETDVDCGGRSCPPCDNGKACLVDFDCMSGYCSLNKTCTTPVLANSPWPMFMHDEQHTGRSEYAGPDWNDDWDVRLKWDPSDKGAYYYQGGAIAHNMLYQGISDFYAINLDTGAVVWQLNNTGMVSTPAIDSYGNVYVRIYNNTSHRTYLFSFEPDGTKRWQSQALSQEASSPIIGPGDMIYISREGYVYAYYSNGSEKWSVNTNASVDLQVPTIGYDGNIYVTGSRQTFAGPINYMGALNPNNGNIIWKREDLFCNVPLAIGQDGTVYVVSTGPGPAANLIALDPANFTGPPKWSTQLARNAYFSSWAPAIDSDGKIYVGARSAFGGSLYVVYPNGTHTWVWSDWDSAPILDANGNIYFGSRNHKFYSLNPDRSLRWSYQTDSEMYGPAVIGEDGSVYVTSYQGTLYAFGTPLNCTDGMQNGDETDIDCGGSCPRCGDGRDCLAKADCQSSYCNPHSICSTPLCNDTWKNGNETGIDCGGVCSNCTIPVSCSDGVQNGHEEGVDCGGICPDECEPILTVLIIPVSWQGSYEEFQSTASQASDNFLNRIPLKDCPNEYKVLISDQIDYDGDRIMWDGWQCNVPEYAPGCYGDGGFVLRVIEYCAKRYGKATGNKYDYVAGITDLNKIGRDPYVNILGQLTCRNWAGGWTAGNSDAVIATTNDIKTVTHELGHQFGFSDQYCDCSGVYYMGIDLGNLCGPNAPINPLNKTLGCDYDGDCCWTTLDDLYPGCHKRCEGNFDRFGLNTNNDNILDTGNHTVMSAEVEGRVERNHYDITEYGHLQNILQCSSPEASLMQEENLLNIVLEINLNISIDDNVTLNYVDVTYGDSPVIPPIRGNYSLRILDENNSTLYESNFSISFLIFSNLSYFTNQTYLHHKIKYNTSMRKIQLFHNNTLLFEQAIDFCDFDYICEPNENHFSCPYDCESWTEDETCNNEYDGVCDLDCLPEYDPDCMKTINISLIKGWNLISIPLKLLNNSVDNVLSSINYSHIFSYDSEWRVPSKINNRLGYWIKVLNETILAINGSIPTNMILDLNPGYNLLGYPSLNETNVSFVFNNVSDDLINVFSYENNSWKSFMPNKTHDLNSLISIKPGLGCWVNVKNTTSWLFDGRFR